MKRLSRRAALAVIIITAGILASGCGWHDETLTTPARPTPALSAAGLPVGYVWQVSYTANVGCGFSWTWTLADGSTVAGGSAGCGTTLSGTGTIPSSATGIEVDASIDGFPAGCTAGKVVTKTLNGSQDVSVSIKLSLPSTSIYDKSSKCPSGSAAFSLHT